MPLISIEPGSFYHFGSRKGFRPVVFYVGRFDEPAEFAHQVREPVVSGVILSLREGMPMVAFAPFYLSTLLTEPLEQTLPVDLRGTDFPVSYANWRRTFEGDEGSVWEIGPAEVYNQAIKAMIESRSQLNGGRLQ